MKSVQISSQNILGNGLNRSDLQDPYLQIVKALNIFLDDFFEIKKGVTVIQEHPAYIGNDDTPVLSFKETQATEFFKCFYLVTHGRLGNKKLC